MWISTILFILLSLLALIFLLIIWMNSQKIDILQKDLDETRGKLKYVVHILNSKGIDVIA